MDEERKAALIAEKLAAAGKVGPVKKPAVKKAPSTPGMHSGPMLLLTAFRSRRALSSTSKEF